MRKTSIELASINPDGSPRPYNQYSPIGISNNDKKEGTVIIKCSACGEVRCFDAEKLSESIKFVGEIE